MVRRLVLAWCGAIAMVLWTLPGILDRAALGGGLADTRVQRLSLEQSPTLDAARLSIDNGLSGYRKGAPWDLALMASYGMLWWTLGRRAGATAAALVIVAVACDLAGTVTVLWSIEHRPTVVLVTFIRGVSLAKWALLGVVWLSLTRVFWPRQRHGCTNLVRLAVALMYGCAGLLTLGGLAVQWPATERTRPLIGIALLLQTVAAARGLGVDWRAGAGDEPPWPSNI